MLSLRRARCLPPGRAARGSLGGNARVSTHEGPPARTAQETGLSSYSGTGVRRLIRAAAPSGHPLTYAMAGAESGFKDQRGCETLPGSGGGKYQRLAPSSNSRRVPCAAAAPVGGKALNIGAGARRAGAVRSPAVEPGAKVSAKMAGGGRIVMPPALPAESERKIEAPGEAFGSEAGKVNFRRVI